MQRTSIETLEGRLLLSASLVKALNLNTAPSNPSDFVDLNGIVYFADNGQLYRTDGTFNGTYEVPNSSPYPTELTRLGNQLFFASVAGLWKVDGTTQAASFLGAGPISPVASPTAHTAGQQGDNPRDLTPVGSLLYFAKLDATGRSTLWRSDGTPGGTFQLPPTAALSNPDSLTNVNGTLFFHANDGVHGDELWKTDGTAAGTALVKDIFPGPTGASLGSFLNINGILYFTADDGDHGLELWRSDGTAAGTVMVQDLIPGPIGSAPSQLTNVNGTLYFVATDGVHGYELWRSNGTAAGTSMVLDLNPGSAGSGLGDLTAAGSTLFFTANTPSTGTELWITDGTAGGTRLVKDIAAGPASSVPSSLLYVNGTLYFRADDQMSGGEFWKSDGTAAGTVLVKDIFPGGTGSGATDFAYGAGAIYFAADDRAHGIEVWKSDGTTAGTTLVRDLNTQTAESNTGAVTEFNGIGYFTGFDGINGQELWRTDGTAAGTYMVADLAPGAASSNPLYLTVAPDALYFVANDLLYKTDGTAAGTVQVCNVVNPSNLTALNGEIFFSGYVGPGFGLWATDGTPAGTTLLRQFSGPVGLDDLTKVHSTLFFSADDGVDGQELWRSDGTPAGTVMVSDINPGPAGSGPWNITDVNGIAMFVANDGVHGNELWESDGTSQGTSIVADINPGPADGQIDHLTYFNGLAVFTANNGISGDELWRSDGTPDGTFPLADINPGPVGSYPAWLTVAGPYLYFRATGTDGARLWRTDGFTGDTVEVADADPSHPLSTPLGLVAVNQDLAFVAFGAGTWRLYQSDGQTAAMIDSADPTDPYQNPKQLGAVGNVVYFTAFNQAHGDTIWSADLSATPFASPSGVLPTAVASAAVQPAPVAAPSLSQGTPNPLPPLIPGAFLYDSSSLTGEPQLDAGTMPQVYITYAQQFFPDGGVDSTEPDPALVRAAADQASALHQPMVVDLETPFTDPRIASQGHLDVTLQQLIDIADWAHQEQPSLKVGFFGSFPPAYFSESATPNPDYTQFLAAMQPLLPLLPHVDFICPVFYLTRESMAGFDTSLKAVVDAVRQFGKPVLPFYSMTYLGQDPDLVGRLLPADAWDDQLRLARQEQAAPILWGGFPAQWSDNAAWWAVTREQVAEAASPNPQLTPDVPLTQTAQPVGQVTINFGVPVTGFSTADLSLTVDGGSNLLGRTQTLSTTDHIKWTLSNLTPLTSAGGQFVLTLRNNPAIRSSAGYVLLNGQTLTWTTPQVVGRFVFYNNSAFDGNQTAINAADDSAIATDKTALLPGVRANFANFTSFSQGINGIMVDIAGPTGTLSAGDFDFRVGNSNTPSQWAAAPLGSGPIVRPGAGVNGSTRVEFVWPANQIQNTWLQVTVKANADTGLSIPDVFYFGNVIGETGDGTGDPVVSQADVQAVLSDPHGPSNPAAITNPHDFNRDGRVDMTDAQIAAANQTTAANAVHRIGYSTFAALLRLAQNYGQPGTRAEGDYTGDGFIDFKDLLIVAQSYMATPPAASTAAASAQFAAQPDDPSITRKLPRPAARQPATVAPTAPLLRPML